jgi:hypothetical protein
MGEDLAPRKFTAIPFIDHSRGVPDVATAEPEAS